MLNERALAQNLALIGKVWMLYRISDAHSLKDINSFMVAINGQAIGDVSVASLYLIHWDAFA